MDVTNETGIPNIVTFFAVKFEMPRWFTFAFFIEIFF